MDKKAINEIARIREQRNFYRQLLIDLGAIVPDISCRELMEKHNE